jgi:hypothetical protein
MNLLRVVTSMAWSDGHLASEEIDLMLDRFSGMFAAGSPQQQRHRQELQEYMTQNIPLEELTPKLQSVEERELVLRLGYEVIRSSSRTPSEEKINEEEAAAYNRLVQLLNLPAETVQRVESEASTQTSSEGVVDSLTRRLEKFIQG